MRQFNPTTVAGPFATYSHGVEIETPARFLFGAGQVGVDPEGRTGEGIEAQARLTWQNIEAVLAEADMAIPDIVQLNMLLTDRADQQTAMRIRDEVLGDHRPASTLIFISGLARPELKIEIDYIAVRPTDSQSESALSP